MPRTIEHLLATHQQSMELRNQGLPIWSHTVRIKDLLNNPVKDSSKQFHAASVANAIASRLRQQLPASWLNWR